MDAHEAHRVGLEPRDRGIGLGPARQRLLRGDVVEKAAQVTALAGLEAARQPQQLVDVGHAPLGRVEAAHVGLVAAAREGPLDQPGDGARGGDAPLAGQALAERGQTRTVGVAESRAQGLEPVVQRRPYGLAALPRGTRDERETIA